MLVFAEGGNRKAQRKTLGARRKTNNKVDPNVTQGPGIEHRPQRWEGALSPARYPRSPIAIGICNFRHKYLSWKPHFGLMEINWDVSIEIPNMEFLICIESFLFNSQPLSTSVSCTIISLLLSWILKDNSSASLDSEKRWLSFSSTCLKKQVCMSIKSS